MNIICKGFSINNWFEFELKSFIDSCQSNIEIEHLFISHNYAILKYKTNNDYKFKVLKLDQSKQLLFDLNQFSKISIKSIAIGENHMIIHSTGKIKII
jgi:hypothetical protein